MKKKSKTYAQGYKQTLKSVAQIKKKKGPYYEKWRDGVLEYAERLKAEK